MQILANNLNNANHNDFFLVDAWQKEGIDPLKHFSASPLYAYLNIEFATQIVFPAKAQVFEALNQTPFDQVKVVIIGQDPYYKAGQANGLSFSVSTNTVIPPSLKNIYKELQRDLNISPPTHGDLHYWAQQGVLLLNTVLTVRENLPGSHRNRGWEQITTGIIQHISAHKANIVFLLWGNDAMGFAPYIEPSKHLLLSSTHPSPLSAYRGFLGCNHFSTTNNYLIQHGLSPIDWQLH